MTVKTRISLLVAGAGFVASLVFSLAVFFELLEQPFEILDVELETEAQRALRTVVARQKEREGEPADPAANEIYTYWLKIYEQKSGKLLFQSGLTHLVDLPLFPPGASTTTRVTIPAGLPSQPQDTKAATYRIRSFAFGLKGNGYGVQIARPIDKLNEEIWELVFSLAAGLMLSSLVLIAISHFIAKKILQPVGEMKDLTQTISERNLDQRLPISSGKDEFNELAKTINHMLDRLQYSFSKQRNFLFDTSHELKTPLATMRLAIDEVCSSEMETLSSAQRDNLFFLNEQVLRIERLVKDLLNLSSLEMVDTIEKEGISLQDILESLVVDYRFLAEAQEIDLDLNLPKIPNITGDAKLLTRAFSNILDNAVKYNLKGGKIIVAGMHTEDMVTITIANTGPGVEKDEIGKVFDQFFRVEKSRSIEHGGSGLGLSIVKRVIELHKGTVTMESRPGQWTTIIIRLPNDGRMTTASKA